MKKYTYIFQFLSLFFALSILLVSCEKVDDKPNPNKVEVTIKAKYAEEIDYSNFKVKITDSRTSTTTEKKLNNGSTKITLNKDIYSFVIEGKYKEIEYFGKKESHTIKGTETVEIDIKPIIVNIESTKKGFVINEIFFYGGFSPNAAATQYLTIYNNSNEVLYADGIVIAESAHENSNKKEFGTLFSKYLPKDIIVQKLFQIPGTGTEHPVEPGKQIVIAANAINHGENVTGAPDLSGADFEAYETHDPKFMDTNSPNVKKLERYFGNFNYFWAGTSPLFIFDPKEDMKSFMDKNKVEFGNNVNQNLFLYKVPSHLVLDGIETGMEGNIAVKALPDNIDKGSILNNSQNSGFLVKRKPIIIDGKERLMDTNNSTVDCIIEKDPTSYPAK